jgi:CRP-like cAMP-binding protein
MPKFAQPSARPSANTSASPGFLEGRIAANLPGARPDSVRSLATTARLRSLHAGDPIFRQGEVTPLTLIVDGYAAFRRTTVDGQQLITAIARPGEMYGVISIAGSIAAADFVSLTDAAVATWSGTALRQLAATDPELSLAVIDRLAGLLVVITERLDGFLHQDARRRVIRVLARYGDLFFGNPPVLSRAHLPGVVGTSREMTSRVLRRLECDGAIARVGQTGLKLLDPAILES